MNDSNKDSHSHHCLIQLQDVRVSLGGKPVLTDITWQLYPGQNWAFLGGNGAGKTTLVRLIRGEVWPDPTQGGRRLYRLDGEERTTPLGVRESVPIVSAELQDSYTRHQWNLTAGEIVLTGYTNSVWLFQKCTLSQIEHARQIVDNLGVASLWDRSFLELSRGEGRKILIARALVSRPRLLVVDEFCNGLDIPSRRNLFEFMENLAQSGVQLISITHRLDELIPSISHVLLLDRGRIVRQGERSCVLTPEWIETTRSSSHPTPRPPAFRGVEEKKVTQAGPPAELLCLENVDVYRGERKVLHQIGWRMMADENWAVLGGNGSGKSTFLSLLYGGLHPALGGHIRRFGIPDGETDVWEIRRRIGFLSAHLQADYEYNLTGEETVLSGFFASVGLWQETTEAMKAAARRWIEYFGIEDLAEREVHSLSYGQFRKILLARALVQSPDILLLDEPCNGLDGVAKAEFLGLLESLAGTSTRLVFVTHHPEEWIPSLRRVLVLEEGRIAFQGERNAITSNTIKSLSPKE